MVKVSISTSCWRDTEALPISSNISRVYLAEARSVAWYPAEAVGGSITVALAAREVSIAAGVLAKAGVLLKGVVEDRRRMAVPLERPSRRSLRKERVSVHQCNKRQMLGVYSAAARDLRQVELTYVEIAIVGRGV